MSMVSSNSANAITIILFTITLSNKIKFYMYLLGGNKKNVRLNMCPHSAICLINDKFVIIPYRYYKKSTTF